MAHGETAVGTAIARFEAAAAAANRAQDDLKAAHAARGRGGADAAGGGRRGAGDGLPIDDGVYLLVPVSGCIDGRPWLARPVTFTEAPILARHLSTACYIVIAYLPGMRPGEVLSLKRGAARHDQAAGLWLLRGRHSKGATGEGGAKLVTGAVRDDPWVVHELTAGRWPCWSVSTDYSWLFPDIIYVRPRQRNLRLRAVPGSNRRVRQPRPPPVHRLGQPVLPGRRPR